MIWISKEITVLIPEDKLVISGYFGRDVLGFRDAFSFDWGNMTVTLRSDHLFSDKLFSNTSFIYSDFDYKLGFGGSDLAISIAATIQNLNFKQDFSYYANEKNRYEFGVNIIKHIFKPGSFESAIEGLNNSQLESKHAIESAVYMANTQKITPTITASYGLRYSNFTQIGPGNILFLNELGELESEKYFEANEV